MVSYEDKCKINWKNDFIIIIKLYIIFLILGEMDKLSLPTFE